MVTVTQNKLVYITYSILDSRGMVVEQYDIPVGYVQGAHSGILPAIESAVAADGSAWSAGERATAIAESDRLMNDRYALLDRLFADLQAGRGGRQQRFGDVQIQPIPTAPHARCGLPAALPKPLGQPRCITREGGAFIGVSHEPRAAARLADAT